MATATGEVTTTIQVGDSEPIPLEEFQRNVKKLSGAGKAMKVRRGEDETVATHTVALRVHTLYRDQAGDE